jgi:hypothetical protein
MILLSLVLDVINSIYKMQNMSWWTLTESYAVMMLTIYGVLKNRQIQAEKVRWWGYIYIYRIEREAGMVLCLYVPAGEGHCLMNFEV